MTAQKKKVPGGTATNLTAILLMGLAVGMLVLLGIGLLMSALVVRGAAGLDGMGRWVLAAMFLSALAGGWFVARKMHTMPLIWSLCAGAEIAVTCLLIGAVTYGISSPMAAVSRVAASLLGGAAAGFLSALRKK